MADHGDGRTDARRGESRAAIARGALTLLVLDASAFVQACLAAAGLRLFETDDLVGPPLLWSESLSAIRELRWRREISDDLASTAFNVFFGARVKRHAPNQLYREARRVADELGWAKTYDAEYVALARILRCPLITLDDRLRRGAGRLVEILGPHEL